MYTIEEARKPQPNPTIHIPQGAMREFEREDIIRVLENDVRAAHAKFRKAFWSALSSVWQRLTGSAIDQTQSHGARLTAQSESAR